MGCDKTTPALLMGAASADLRRLRGGRNYGACTAGR
jgi:dihydroxyacid dehydratase/phosphogluconate dehydratase